MRFAHPEEITLFADSVRDLLAAECTPERVRTTWESGSFDDGRWKALAGTGVAGVLVPESHGGLGLDAPVSALFAELAGVFAVPEPLAEVLVASSLLAALDGEVAAEWLPRVAAGEAIVVPALAGDPYPAHVEAADLVLLQNAPGKVVAITPDNATVAPQPNLDGGRPTATLTMAPGGDVVGSWDDVDRALLEAAQLGATLAAAGLVGAATSAIHLARDYALTREQFGQPIGQFQAVKHLLASPLVDVEFSRPLVEKAAFALASGDADASLHVSAAKAFAGDAARGAATAALQVHGAIGYTWECDLHLWLKRTWSLMAAWGDTELHWQTVEDDLGLT